MIAGVLKEPSGENRVSLLPEQLPLLFKKNIQVWVQQQAGIAAYATDAAYTQAGANINDRTEILQQADVLFSIHPLTNDDIQLIKPGTIVVGVFQPLYAYKTMQDWASKSITTFSLDAIPRTTRAQSMDVLSSQANIAGYKAVIIAAANYGRFFPMFITAAGSIPPAKVLVLGAGVAGLQAIATAKRLGAVIEVFDTRPAVKEEVMSLGAKFVEVEGAADAANAGGYAVEQSAAYQQKQQQRIAEAAAKADIIVTTAQIPGKPAPKLLTEAMITQMRNGSIIVDLAAATGGNTPLTQNNATIVTGNGVTIIGNSNLPATMPFDASKLYGKNLLNFLQLIVTSEGNIYIPFEDDIVQGCCITHNGKIVNERVLALIQ
ncbi:MAG: Re/Si-specific NAD(P)(+) transhydrogenase subunit alpha [Hydrotalea flava]|nr:Re/Si-specific NAD(P)(+) transhydrogenase subunit alpha [Hydrotalea flava]NIM37427.1 Re/Si-specific NAD(P)(+) transhydrogenase subunit alpha [Hydrotalea flava]NIN04379.1 Re/Si-specific NAD(P)(+) transhydrogenase subunit alpha [Hydrotalea flava]NIN14871.1 Re/Si-specific NAD(P)(+) transhydrogenase subunit alpha [Hydrotalea flava]NIO93353.1 Re/Si-specific NAD(P)(+) transhydrogenase subunit alpha [Hydrotalea flava]